MGKPLSSTVRAAMIHPGDVAAHLMPSTSEEADKLEPHDIEAIRSCILDRIIELIREAHRHGTQLITLGELCSAPYFALEERKIWKQFAEDMNEGPSVKQLCEISKELGIVIVAPLYEKDASIPDGEQAYFDTSVIIDNGVILGRDRKLHIPEGSNEKGGFHEPFYYGPNFDPTINEGNPKVITRHSPLSPSFETSVGIITVRTCYSRHFPQSMQVLRNHKVQIVVAPSITFGTKSQNLWRAESKVWAGWGNCFALFLNRHEAEKGPWKPQKFFGDSHATDPQGAHLEPIDESRAPEMIIVDMDLKMTEHDGSGWHLERDTRLPEEYWQD